MKSPVTVIGFACDGITTLIRFDGVELEEAGDRMRFTRDFESLNGIIYRVNCEGR